MIPELPAPACNELISRAVVGQMRCPYPKPCPVHQRDEFAAKGPVYQQGFSDWLLGLAPMPAEESRAQ